MLSLSTHARQWPSSIKTTSLDTRVTIPPAHVPRDYSSKLVIPVLSALAVSSTSDYGS